MSAVNESVVREYFEFLGFLVSQPRKYAALGRGKSAEEEIDLLVWNPLAREHVMPEHLVWGTDDLRTVAKAVIGVRGWHTERFYVSTFEQTPEILRFAESDCTKIAARMLGDGPMAKVLCLPRLPASGELKRQTIQTLKDKGVDGVISFKTMLTEIIRRVETNRNYEKSDLLQTIRLLKNYDLIAGEQMELFAGNRHSPRRRKDEAAGEG
ncbi:MAG: hypothetical protein FJ224_09775 [Lentisphaerae bacterium]|nr:hypothetical protein [Lentisphaerota bacterium]